MCNQGESVFSGRADGHGWSRDVWTLDPGAWEGLDDLRIEQGAYSTDSPAGLGRVVFAGDPEASRKLLLTAGASGTTDLHFEQSGTIEVAQGQTYTTSGDLQSGVVPFVKDGAGSLVLNGGGYDFVGRVDIRAGRLDLALATPMTALLEVQSSGSLRFAAVDTVGIDTWVGLSGGDLIIDAPNPVGTVRYQSGTVGGTAPLQLMAGGNGWHHVATVPETILTATIELKDRIPLLDNVYFNIYEGRTLRLEGPVHADGGLLRKIGPGTLVLAAENNLKNGVRLEEGVLGLAHRNALYDAAYGAAPVRFSGGTIRADVNYASVLSLELLGEEQHTIDTNGLRMRIENVQGSGGLRVVGDGVLDVRGFNHTYTGGMTITDGAVVTVDNWMQVPEQGELRLDGGALSFSQSMGLSKTIHIGPAGGRIGGSLQFRSRVEGPGRLTLAGSGGMIMHGPRGHTGGVTVDRVTVYIETADELCAASDETVDLTSGGRIWCQKSATLERPVRVLDSGTILVDHGGSVRIGALSGSGVLTKEGWGTLSTGESDGTVGLNVEEGFLRVKFGGEDLVQSADIRLGYRADAELFTPYSNLEVAGDVYLADSATLRVLTYRDRALTVTGDLIGVGTLWGSYPISLQSTIDVDPSAGLEAESLVESDPTAPPAELSLSRQYNEFILADSSRLILDVTAAGSEKLIADYSEVFLGGTLVLRFDPDMTVAEGQVYQILGGSGSFHGGFNAIELIHAPAGLTADDSLAASQHTVTIVPEPATLSILCLGALSLMGRTPGRNRRRADQTA